MVSIAVSHKQIRDSFEYSKIWTKYNFEAIIEVFLMKNMTNMRYNEKMENKKKSINNNDGYSRK